MQDDLAYIIRVLVAITVIFTVRYFTSVRKKKLKPADQIWLTHMNQLNRRD